MTTTIDDKVKEKYKEGFKKGVTVGNDEIIKILTENKDKLSIELKDRGLMEDETEFMTIRINISK